MNRSLTQNWLSPSAITDFGTQAPSDWFRPVQRPRSMSDIIEAPLLPVRDTVLFPHLVSPLFVGRDRSVKAIEAAQLNHESVIVVAQRDPENEDPQPEEFYRMGTEVLIGRALRMPDGTTSVLAQGQRRAEILDFVQTEPYYRVRVRLIDDPIAKPASTEALDARRAGVVREGDPVQSGLAGRRLCVRHECGRAGLAGRSGGVDDRDGCVHAARTAGTARSQQPPAAPLDFAG